MNESFLCPYPIGKYNKIYRASSMPKHSLVKETAEEDGSASNSHKGWGIPRSFRMSNDMKTETVKSMKEQCMKNVFIHTQYDSRLDDFKSKLFLEHIFSLSKPNLVNDEEEDGELNLMDYLFKKLDVSELLEIEKKINNERLYNKDTSVFQHRRSFSKPRESKIDDQGKFRRKNELREFIDRVNNGPTVILPIEKKRRVFEAIDLGLKKYMPKKKKHFKMQLKMVEKMLEGHEDKAYILSQLDPPPGISYTKRIKDKERKIKQEIERQIELEKELRMKQEQEK